MPGAASQRSLTKSFASAGRLRKAGAMVVRHRRRKELRGFRLPGGLE